MYYHEKHVVSIILDTSTDLQVAWTGEILLLRGGVTGAAFSKDRFVQGGRGGGGYSSGYQSTRYQDAYSSVGRTPYQTGPASSSALRGAQPDASARMVSLSKSGRF